MSSPSPSGNHSNPTEGQSEDVGGGPVKCVVCGDFFERKDLEGHISSDHLDYYPYSCGHCGHFMPTEELVIFHAERKSHLPIKIRENLNKNKETKLQEIFKKCLVSPIAENQNDSFTVIQDQISKRNGEIASTDHTTSSGSTYSDNLFAAFAPEKFNGALGSCSLENSEDMPVIHTENAMAAVKTAIPSIALVGKTPSLSKPVKKTERISSPGAPPQPSAVSTREFQAVQVANEEKVQNHPEKVVVFHEQHHLQKSDGVDVAKPVANSAPLLTTETVDGGNVKKKATDLKVPVHPNQPSPAAPVVQPSSNLSSLIHVGIPAASAFSVQNQCSPIDTGTLGQPPTAVAVQSHCSTTGNLGHPIHPPVEGEPITPLSVVANSMSPRPLSSSSSSMSRKMLSVCAGTGVPLSLPHPMAASNSVAMHGVTSSASHMPAVFKPHPVSNSMLIQYSGSTPVAVSNPVVIPNIGLVTVSHNGKQKRGIEQIANQLAAVSQPIRKQPRMEPLQLLNTKPDIVSEKPSAPIAPSWQRSHCQMCHQFVPVSELCNHIEKHVVTRPMYGCLYCNFKGKTANSVRVHITWKHAHCCARAGAGVKDISDIGATASEMLSLCFPNFSQSQYDEIKLALPSTLSPTSTKESPSSQFNGTNYTSGPGDQRGSSAGNHHQSNAPEIQVRRSFPTSSGATVPVGSTVTRTATMPSGRVYRYMTCTVCGAEVIDALASSHIYQVHINRRDAIQCGYCNYGVPYAIAEVKRHVQAKHPYQPQKIIDRRPEMQEEYMAWRVHCFPDIGTRQPSKSMGYSYESSPTLVKINQINQPTHGERDNALVDILKRPPIPIEMRKSSTDTRQQYWTQAHIKNSKKTRCSKCWEEITHLWANRHIWRHLEEEHMSRYKCKAPGCEFQTYLMRSLDTHCNYHGKGLTAEMVGYEDQADQLRSAWVKCWKECFGDEEVPNHVSSSASPDVYSSYDSYGENQMENNFCGSPTTSDSGVDAATNLLLVAAQGQHQVNSTMQLTKSQSRDLMFSQISSYATTLTSQGIKLPVTSAQTDEFCLDCEFWCQKCSCTVAVEEIDDHIWFAHLGGILPYRCGRCQRSFVSEQLVRDHWELEHYLSPSAALTGSMEVTKNSHAGILFVREMAECFPDVATQIAAFSTVN